MNVNIIIAVLAVQQRRDGGEEVAASFHDNTAIYLQIAKKIADDIVEGQILEGEQVPSTNQFAAFYQINPATAAKGINLLVEEGILFKKRGIGMFVAEGARAKLMNERRETFYEEFVVPLIKESEKIGISKSELLHMIAHRTEGNET